MSGWYLGVDGGGTKTIARLAFYHSDGTIARTVTGRAGGSNLVSFPADIVAQHVLEAIAEARRQAGLGDEEVRGAVLAMAGAGNASRREKFQRWAIGAGLAEQTTVIPDAWAALAAGVPDGIGIVLVVGTGSIAMGRTADGKWQRAGGWGPSLGDEGSGYWIGREAIREVLVELESCDGIRVADPLASEVLMYFQVSGAAELIEEFYRETATRARIADLSRVVSQLSDDSELARRVWGRAVKHLAELLERLVRRMEHGGRRDEKIPWVVAGGVAWNDPRFVRALTEECHACEIPLSAPIVVDDPSIGAVIMAFQQSR